MYACLFESVIPKNNEILHNRNKTSHPYILYSNEEIKPGTKYRSFRFFLILMGDSTKYFPYIYAALQKAGESGLDKNRTPFQIESVTADGFDTGQREPVLPNIPGKIWTPPAAAPFRGEILVQLLTPLRFKSGGKYTTGFSALDFFLCLSRRLSVLCRLYGKYEEEKYHFPNDNIFLKTKHLSWTEDPHYSARQKEQIKIGGVTGNFTLEGHFSAKELTLLEFAKIFGAGKNTNFGLGRLDYWLRKTDEEKNR